MTVNPPRHELKYIIPLYEKALLTSAFSGILEPDSNAENGVYHIRSLYLEDCFLTAYKEKVDGIKARKKYRMRIYNKADGFVRLECKEKPSDRIVKRSCCIDRSIAADIANGDFSSAEKLDDPLCAEICALSRSRLLSPRIIIDYKREAYCCSGSDLRITFDTSAAASAECSRFFEDDPSLYSLSDIPCILEVKYGEQLPKHISSILSAVRSSKQSVSKYVTALDAVKQLCIY